MNRKITKGLRALALLALALLLAPTSAHAVLERVGPNSPTNFLPTYFQDTTGITFDFCTPLNQAELDGGWCKILPADVPGGLAPEVFPNAFSGEHFYWGADIVGTWNYTPTPANPNPPFVTGRITFVQAIEAAFLGAIGPGLGQVFGRVRIFMRDLPETGNYKFYTPWGIKVIPGVAGNRIFDTEDIGTACAPFTYDCALQTSIGPFLVPASTPGGPELAPVTGPVPGRFYISDPIRIGPVTGSPIVGNYTLGDGTTFNPNGLAIETPSGQVIFRDNNFSTTGRYFTDPIPSRVAVDRASYSRTVNNDISVDVYAKGEPTIAPRLPTAANSVPEFPVLAFFNAPCVGTPAPTPTNPAAVGPPWSSPGGVSVPMSSYGNLFYGHSAPTAVPAGVCLVNLNAKNAQGVIVPQYEPAALNDQVHITEAFYDPNGGGSLTVLADSSDLLLPPQLVLGAFGAMTLNAPLTNGQVVLAPLAAPPATIRVLSQEGGVNTAQVRTGRRPATGVTLTADLPSPQLPGTAVTFTAVGQGSSGYLYRFWLNSGAGYVIVQDWNALNTWVLPNTTPEGSYQVRVDVWTGSLSTPPDATSTAVTMVLRPPAATGVTLTADRASPATVTLSPVPTVFTAAGQGSTFPYQYRFSLSTNGGAFALRQDWSATATWTLPASTPAGNYNVRVDVRTSSLSAGDASTTLAFVLVNPPPATGVTLTPSLPSPQLPGTAVTFTAVGQGSVGYQYRFWFFGATGWTIVQNYSALDTWALPTNLPTGNYQVSVQVRTTLASTGDAASPNVPFTLANPPATGVTLSADLASPQIPGTVVTFTAQGQGSPAPYQYKFWRNNGVSWSVVQDWSATNTYQFGAGTAPGSYLVSVQVRTSSTSAGDASSPNVAMLLRYPPATGVTVTPSLVSPQQFGTAVDFTAAGQGSSNYEYRFWRRGPTGWSVVRDWNAGAVWTMPGTTVAGSYQVSAEARTAGGTAADVSSAAVPFVIQ